MLPVPAPKQGRGAERFGDGRPGVCCRHNSDNRQALEGMMWASSEVRSFVSRVVFDASLADREHIAYPVANPDDPANTLTVRDSIEGPRRFIPKSEWKLDKTRVYLASGFQPGKIYKVVYKSQDPPVVGAGPATLSDVISHLKYRGSSCRFDTP
jgi:hypothetical protein